MMNILTDYRYLQVYTSKNILPVRIILVYIIMKES